MIICTWNRKSCVLLVDFQQNAGRLREALNDAFCGPINSMFNLSFPLLCIIDIVDLALVVCSCKICPTGLNFHHLTFEWGFTKIK